MHKILQGRSLLLATLVPALLVTGCASGGGTEAMGGSAASPGAPSSDMSSMPTESASPSESMEAKNTPKGVVQSYFGAIKAGKVDDVVALFDNDAVVALEGAATADGTDAIRKAYQGMMTGPMSGTYTIEDTEKLGDVYALVRATSQQDSQNYREFFILEKSSNGWKIDRLISNQSS
ncbi:YybH family protein [Nonomuraea sp. NPDC050383]|uniref:YybH family protein n=1 Tax=Nonomuraea sp. NPDC050383 TaxID=3364362 RepID=UPI003788CA01